MEIVKVSLEHPDPRILKKAGEVLRRGGVIVYPTDTAYALGCDVKNARALARVFKIKERPLEKALPLIAGSVAMVKKFCKIDKTSARLIKKYWPGPLTLVLDGKIPKSDLGNFPKSDFGIAVRVPDCEIARLLSQKLGRPIVSTSANIFGEPTCYSVVCFLRQFRSKKNLPDLILDAGLLPRRKPSTIAKVIDGKIKVLREGTIKI